MLRELFGKRRQDGSVESRLLAEISIGGRRFRSLVLTRNRRVMASVAEDGVTLRLHEAFRDAPPPVLHALGRLFSTTSPRMRVGARDEVRAFLASCSPPPTPPSSGRARPPHATDLPHLRRLKEEFSSVNAAFFGGRLPEVPLRLSGRMRRRNGHFSVEPLEIAISRKLCESGADGEAERTMRHEMIHLWQHVDGRKPGHGADFRRWARRLEIHPRATRRVVWSETSE